MPYTLSATTPCPPNPVPPPSCPCTGSTLTDNTIASSGVWCFNGGDDTLSSVTIQGTAIVYICSDVVLWNWSFNSNATLVIAPGTNVTIGSSYGSVFFNSGVTVVNYGITTIHGFVSFSSGASLFNSGSLLTPDRTIINAGAIYVGTPGSYWQADSLTLNGTCAACLNGSSIETNFLQTGSGSNNLCGDTLFSCVSINLSANVTSSLTSDSTIGVCGPGTIYIDSTNYGNAIVSTTCPCQEPTSIYLLELTGNIKDNKALLYWKWKSIAPDVALYVVTKTFESNENVVTISDTTTSTSWIDYHSETCNQLCIYQVLAHLKSREIVKSNRIQLKIVDKVIRIYTPPGSNLSLKCMSPVCHIRVLTLDGKVILDERLYNNRKQQAYYPLPSGLYLLIQPITGKIALGW